MVFPVMYVGSTGTIFQFQVQMRKHCDLDLDKTYNDFTKNETIDGEETGNIPNGEHEENRKQVCHTMTMKECETYIVHK